MKRLKIELDNLKSNNGRIIALLPTGVIAVDTESEEFGISIAILWYVLSITYYYGSDLDC